MDQVAVENAKKSFLQSWSEYIETIKKSTEIYERQMHLAKYEVPLWQETCIYDTVYYMKLLWMHIYEFLEREMHLAKNDVLCGTK